MNQPAIRIEQGAVKLERLLPGPIERVWAYLVDGEKRSRWFAGGEMEPRAGGRGELKFEHSKLSAEKTPPEKHKDKGKPGAPIPCTVTRHEPNRAFAFEWEMRGGMTETIFELEPRGKDVLLTVTHRRLGSRDLEVMVSTGWDAHVGILEDVLNGVEPRGFWSTIARLEKQYAAAL